MATKKAPAKKKKAEKANPFATLEKTIDAKGKSPEAAKAVAPKAAPAKGKAKAAVPVPKKKRPRNAGRA